MSDNHNAESPSRTPRRRSFEEAQNSTETQQEVASPPPFAQGASSFCMPSSERNRYSNKESVKVNAGLAYGSRHEHDEDEDCAALYLWTGKPAVDIDFSQLIAPITPPEPKPTSEALANRLLTPPPHAFVHGVLSMQWVIGLVGKEHIEFRAKDERYVLAQASHLRESGTSLGLPALYMEWLRGDDAEVSASELGVNLTPAFFKDINEYW
jgi:hypothetical protein